MKTILETIVEVKQVETKTLPVSLEATVRQSPRERFCFRQALANRDRVSLIAELKKASPSEGVIRHEYDPITLSQLYECSGASAISVLTDRTFFKGSLDHLKMVSESVSIPVLRKDFIIDSKQVIESVAAGADAILLIASLLSVEQLREFRELAESFGLDALIEIHDDSELKKALKSGARIVGINNRDLKTFKVDLRTTLQLVESIPENVFIVSESGIKDRFDMRRLKGRVNAALVGTTIMKATHVEDEIRSLLLDRPVLKVCGVQSLETVQLCEDRGVDMVGFNFYEKSPRFIHPQEAKFILGYVTKMRTVGLFVDEDLDRVNEIAEMLDLDFVQLHGNESPEYCSKIVRPVIKAFLGADKFEKSGYESVVEFPLFDLQKGESGVIQLLNVPQGPYFLAGGLRTDNIGSILENFSPFAVDVARGVERFGKKDRYKISLFLNALNS